MKLTAISATKDADGRIREEEPIEIHVNPAFIEMAYSFEPGVNDVYFNGRENPIHLDEASFAKVARWMDGDGEIPDVNACAPHAGAGL